MCTPATARPLGSLRFLKATSHSSAMAVEHATLASWFTLRAAESLKKDRLSRTGPHVFINKKDYLI